jgi:hypothetical protein
MAKAKRDQVNAVRLTLGVLAGIAGSMVATQVAVAQEGTTEEAVAYFDSAFKDRCRPYSETLFLFDGGADEMPARFEVSWMPSFELPGDEPETATIYQFFCDAGAYNVQSAFIKFMDEHFDPLAFARPAISIENETEDYDSPVKAITVTGYESALTLTNAKFDEESQTVTARAYWRGIGDAYDEGRWVFRDGGFVLEHFEADADYDGEIDPQLSLDY